MGSQEIPKPLSQILTQVKDRIQNLVKQYKSLANYGRPYLEDLKEIAVIYYLNEKLNYSLSELASYLSVDKTSLYKLVNRIKQESKVSYTDPQTKKVVTQTIDPNQLINLVESEILNVSSKQKISDPLMSGLIKEFLTKDIERQSNRDRREHYNEREKLESVRVVKELMDKALEHNMVSNPDLWEKSTLIKLLELTYPIKAKRRKKAKLLRRIPRFREWLEGYVGAEKKYINPKESTLFYEDYVKLKRLYKENKISESEFLVVWLHITTGVREGYSSEGVKDSDNLDNVNTSLLGLRWENLTNNVLKVWENKTQKWWVCDLTWLDPEPFNLLLNYKKEKGSIVKTLTNIETVKEFRVWYRNLCKKISKLLNLSFRLTPHDLRRSHLSILAELGIPLEIAVSDKLDFGVGWEDLSTAYTYYLRFSKLTKERIIRSVREIQREIESKA